MQCWCALEPGAGLAAATSTDMTVARGPGKLTRALGIGRMHTGTDLCTDARLFIAAGRTVADAEVATGPRVGVDYAGPWAAEPLRFWIAGHPAVSRPPRSRKQPR